MQAIRSTPGAYRLFSVSVVARLPMAMLSVALLVHAKHLTGSFAAAGVVDGVYAISLAVGGPLLGRIVDRRGQTCVLVASAVAAAAALAALATLPQDAPMEWLVAPALALGLAAPPVGACLRALLSELVTDPDAAASAYAADATATELTWILGPPLAIALATALSTGAALAGTAVVLLAATVAFAADPASRRWRPAPHEGAVPARALQSPALRTLVIALIAVGALLGAVQVGVVAAAEADGATAAAGPLLGVWGLGSLLGGLLATRLGGGAREAGMFSLVLAGLTVGHVTLMAGAGSVVALGALLLVAGAAIAPTYASAYVMAGDAAPSGAVTEAFSWLATAAAIGGSAGAAVAGSLVEQAGPVAAFALAGAAGSIAVLATTLRAATLAAA